MPAAVEVRLVSEALNLTDNTRTPIPTSRPLWPKHAAGEGMAGMGFGRYWVVSRTSSPVNHKWFGRKVATPIVVASVQYIFILYYIDILYIQAEGKSVRFFIKQCFWGGDREFLYYSILNRM